MTPDPDQARDHDGNPPRRDPLPTCEPSELDRARIVGAIARRREFDRLRAANAALLIAAQEAVAKMEQAGVGYGEVKLRAAIALATGGAS